MRWRGAAVAAIVGLIVASGAVLPAAPSGAALQAGHGTVVASDDRAVRRLLFDLQDDADPTATTVGVGRTALFAPGANRRAVLLAMQEGPEGRGATVDGLFTSLLRRPAEPAARTFFSDRLARTGRLKVAADLIASAEFAATQGGGTEGGWVDALYRDALGRPADGAGRQYFIAERAAGRSRGSIASAVTGGQEGRRALVGRLMRELLRRAADPGGVAYFADRIAAGWSVERVVVDIAGSAEYLTKARALPVDEPILYLRAGNRLISTTTHGEGGPLLTIHDLENGEEVRAIAVRPTTGVLYGVTSAARLITISPGGTVAVVGGPISGLTVDGAVGLDIGPDGAEAVVTVGSTRVRIEVATGAAVASGASASFAYVSGDLHEGGQPEVTGIASSLVLDRAADAVATTSAAAELTTVGPLHLDADGVDGLDVSPVTGTAYALLDTPDGGVGLHVVDPASGEPRRITSFDDSSILGMAVAGGANVPIQNAAVFSDFRLATTTTGLTGPPGSDIVLGTGPHIALAQAATTGFSTLVRLRGDGQLGRVHPGSSPLGVASIAEIGSPLPDVDPALGADLDDQEGGTDLWAVNGDRLWSVDAFDGSLAGPARGLAYGPGDANADTVPDVGGLASTHGADGALYGVDQGTDAVVVIDPTTGVVATVAALDPIVDVVGFDVTPGAGQAGWLIVEGPVDAFTLLALDLPTGEVRTTRALTGTIDAFTLF